MFVRSCWQPQSTEDMFALIETNPWALIITAGGEGLDATNLPLLLERGRGPLGVLVGHIAVANHQASILRAATDEVLVVFQGPYSYVTPSWYPRRDMPSTYYYMTVHCRGRIREQTREALEASLETLTVRMESAIPHGWRMSEIPRSDITRRLPAIMGFEIDVSRIEGKFKLGQDEPLADALAVAEALALSDEAPHRALAEAVRRHNIDRAG
jgi:transcriptional regulator